MPISLSQDARHGWLIARVTERLTAAQTLDFLRTARAEPSRRMIPLLFDARGCSTDLTLDDVDAAVGLVQTAVREGQRRGHVALVADIDGLYRWFLLYEARCIDAGIRLIRVFRHGDDAERWLEIVSAAREFG